MGLQVGTGTFDGATSEDLTSYGLHAGYLRDLGQYVVGAEIDYDRLEIDTFSSNDNGVTRLKGIVGYDAGKLLPYAILGAANFQFEDGLGGDLDTLGVVYGVGASYKVTDKVRLGAEVLQH